MKFQAKDLEQVEGGIVEYVGDLTFLDLGRLKSTVLHIAIQPKPQDPWEGLCGAYSSNANITHYVGTWTKGKLAFHLKKICPKCASILKKKEVK